MLSSSKRIPQLADQLSEWYQKHQRPLPWRRTPINPYAVFLSEMMLQQTTIQTVVPYFEKFIQKFPQVKDLAQASVEEVLSLWSGLGYYSRARNLHKAAAQLMTGFPKTHLELIRLPGVGPYTARAISSISFQEPVGVVDGNVIRVLCRLENWKIAWWKTQERKQIQNFADALVKFSDPRLLNQGLMDLGAMVCTPKNPRCTLCPWVLQCVSHKKNEAEQLPLKKPRRSFEIWHWKPQLHTNSRKEVALIQNPNLPFLKNQWVFPGPIERTLNKPEFYDFLHHITHHRIYVSIQKNKPFSKKTLNMVRWVKPHELDQINPSSLLKKIL